MIRIVSVPLGMKETAFLSSISSAGLIHAIAQGCSRGTLERCSCDDVSFSAEANREAWKWGGCGDNLRYSQRYLKDFLKNRSSGSRDLHSKMSRHNSDLGLRVRYIYFTLFLHFSLFLFLSLSSLRFCHSFSLPFFPCQERVTGGGGGGGVPRAITL